MEEVIIYTDGACSGNPGSGGWGAILMINENKKEISGGNKNALLWIIPAISCGKYNYSARSG